MPPLSSSIETRNRGMNGNYLLFFVGDSYKLSQGNFDLKGLGGVKPTGTPLKL